VRYGIDAWRRFSHASGSRDLAAVRRCADVDLTELHDVSRRTEERASPDALFLAGRLAKAAAGTLPVPSVRLDANTCLRNGAPNVLHRTGLIG